MAALIGGESRRGGAHAAISSHYQVGENRGGHPLVPPFQSDSTPLDSPKGEKGILTVAGDVYK